MEVRNILEKLGVDTTELDVLQEDDISKDPLLKAINTNDHKSYKTFIKDNVIIDGDIVSNSSVDISGEVNGNIICTGDVIIRGQIIGDINARNLKVIGGKLKGNINIKGKVLLNDEAYLLGDIKCNSLKNLGKLEGNIEAFSEVEILEEANVVGNVTAGMISIKEGAKFNGSLNMRG